MKVGIDIDGPVYSWHFCLYRYFTEYKNYVGSEVEFWNYFRTLEKEVQDYYVSLPHLYFNMFPSKDVIENLKYIAEIAEIFYITSREEHLQPITLKFFNNLDLPFKENIIFSKDKATYVRLLGLDYFLDDQPNNLIPMMKTTKTFLFKCPHNVGQRDGFNTVGSMREFYKTIIADVIPYEEYQLSRREDD